MAAPAWTTRVAPALLLFVATATAACGAVLGFPDRSLDEELADGSATEAAARPGEDGGAAPDGAVPVEAGPATAGFSRSAVDFGLVACGAPAPADQVLTITNVGGAPLTWTATLSSTPQFAIVGAAGGTIGPGASGTVTISSIAIPALSGAGDTQQATLTLSTNDPAKAATEVPIKVTAAGGTISIVPLTAALGESPVNLVTPVPAPDVSVLLKNTGNAPITLSLGAPKETDANGNLVNSTQFAVSWTGTPAAVTVAPGATMTGLVGKFTPNEIGDSAATAALTVTSGALCGTNPTALTLTGKGTNAAPSVTPGSLDFGLVSCGATAAAKTVTIRHTGAFSTQDFNWTASLAGSNFTLSKTSGTLSNGATDTITVTPNMIPAASAVTPNLYGDTLTITTTGAGAVGDLPHVVDLVMTAQGAILQQSAPSIDFGSVKITKNGSSPFTVTNVGNAPATVSYTSSNTAFTVDPQSQTVAGGSSYPATATFSPLAQTTYDGTATMTVPGGTVLCAPLPPAITMTGKGAVSATITPNNLDFGLVPCGTKATNRTVELKNEGNQPFDWSATLGKGSAVYTVSPASSGGAKLLPGASITLTITPITIPGTSTTAADFYADTLSVQTTPPLESPYLAAIHMTAQGAVLSFNPTSLAFGSVREDRSKALPFSVINAGNLAANVTFSDGSSHFYASPSSLTVNANASASGSAVFNPQSTGNKSATMTMSTSATLCAPLPAGISMTGNGT